MLDYPYFKDSYKLIPVDLSKRKSLGVDQTAIQQIVFQGVVGGVNNTKISLYTIFEKSKEAVLEFYKGTAKVLWIVYMVEYSKVNFKRSNLHLNKFKFAAKNQARTTFRMSLKKLDGINLPHELLLTGRQKRKLKNAFENNMSTDVKLSKAQISKIIQSGGFLGSLLSKLAGPLMKVAVPLAKTILFPLGITAAATATDAGIQKKNTWFCKNNFNNFKQRNEWRNENCSSCW